MAVTRTALGTFQNKGSTPDPETILSSVTLATGESIVVMTAQHNCIVVGVTWNGLSLTQEATVDIGGNNDRAEIWARHDNTGATGDVVVDYLSLISSSARAFAVIKLAGLIAAPLDKTGTNFNTTTSTTSLSASTSAATTQADEFMLAALCRNGPNGDAAPAFTTDAPTEGQVLGTTGGSAASNTTIAEGYGVLTSVGTKTSDVSWTTGRACALCVATYKAVVAAAIPNKILSVQSAVRRASYY